MYGCKATRLPGILEQFYKPIQEFRFNLALVVAVSGFQPADRNKLIAAIAEIFTGRQVFIPRHNLFAGAPNGAIPPKTQLVASNLRAPPTSPPNIRRR